MEESDQMSQYRNQCYAYQNLKTIWDVTMVPAQLSWCCSTANDFHVHGVLNCLLNYWLSVNGLLKIVLSSATRMLMDHAGHDVLGQQARRGRKRRAEQDREVTELSRLQNTALQSLQRARTDCLEFLRQKDARLQI